MQIKPLSLCVIVSIVTIGVIIYLNLSSPDESKIFQFNNQNKISAQEKNSGTFISKGTLLLLLAVGIVGALGISRKKKGNENHAKKNDANRTPNHQRLNE